ncbi:predicted protein [Sclerotinia sclerotiorum 1980 UF-70]|uniref:Uncharacterized protein n=1 Tax=Sclerotinia sclerotiorum (strain ATCC 18683 / 1980 / Ss-1) TaxID=665079 RepID=A7EJ09_SCLS1|nr:predicted protein [Sclerotinia sclerotiorum 1980 UF-70]EDO02825.1 predicted protein [Sclerotinia sclerotiorum 1980 UF-70]
MEVVISTNFKSVPNIICFTGNGSWQYVMTVIAYKVCQRFALCHFDVDSADEDSTPRPELAPRKRKASPRDNISNMFYTATHIISAFRSLIL